MKGFILLASMISVLLVIKFVVPFLEKKYNISRKQTVNKIKVQKLEIR